MPHIRAANSDEDANKALAIARAFFVGLSKGLLKTLAQFGENATTKNERKARCDGINHSTMTPCFRGWKQQWSHGLMTPWYRGGMVSRCQKFKDLTYLVLPTGVFYAWIEGSFLISRRKCGSCNKENEFGGMIPRYHGIRSSTSPEFDWEYFFPH